ncbi:MAG: META domain-containing protein [Chromatiales bacterium]|nr:META domain-containing protein [Chromatiales bacterium]
MKNIIGTLIFTVLLVACAAQERAQEPAQVTHPDAVDFSVLAGDWILDSLEGEKWLGEPRVTMNLSDGGRFSGSGGCNRYFGVFTLAEGKLSTGPIGSTMMACEQAAMDLEYRYLASLEKVASITRGDALLHLLDEQARELVVLRAAPPAD